MQNQPKGRIISDGGVEGNNLVGFPDGVDSFSFPMQVKPSQVRWMENGVNRGGILQTRPGYVQRLAFDVTEQPYKAWWDSVGNPSIHPQMEMEFTPSNGAKQLILCVSGSVWTAEINYDGTLETPVLIQAAAFSPYSDLVNGCLCVQTATIVSGVYANNQVPRNLIVIQDGVNRAGTWDGAGWQTMNPSKLITVDADGNTLFPVGYNEIPIGLWMMWSGNRLWVGNGRVARASDLQDPTHFTEEMILTSGGAWVFPGDITGMIDRGISGTTNSQGIITTASTVWAMATGVQNRFPGTNSAGWVNTPNFQTKLFSAVGCIAGKSLIVHRGLLYWMSQDGIVVFDSTGTVFSTQNLPPIDQEMQYSKRRMAGYSSGVCAGLRDSYVFWSVPVGNVLGGRPYNGHTQVLDRQTTVVKSLGLNGPFAYGTVGWQGVWTGIRPIQWATCDVMGVIRPYAFSMDTDGVPRIWEAFQSNRADNGQEIPWKIETRLHPMTNTVFETSVFRHARVLMDQIIGNVNLQIFWRGMRGQYHQSLVADLTATPGSILLDLPEYSPIVNETTNESFTVQTRTIVTPDNRGADLVCQAADVESPFYDDRDHGFGLLLKLNGRAAIVAYRIAADASEDTVEGNADPKDETGFNIVPEASCPRHADGNTPDYIAHEGNPRDAFTPVIPVFDDSEIYQSPVA